MNKTIVEAYPHTIRVFTETLNTPFFGVMTTGQKADRNDILDVIVKGLAAQKRQVDIVFRDHSGREVKREEWLALKP